MANQYKMVITAVDSNNTNDTKKEQEKDSFKEMWKDTPIRKAAGKFASFYSGTQLLRTIAHNEIGLMSVRTGNDYQQRRIQGYMNMAETLVSTGIAFAINPIAGVLSLANTAISLGAEARENSIALSIQSYEASQIRMRAGGAFNRSRDASKF